MRQSWEFVLGSDAENHPFICNYFGSRRSVPAAHGVWTRRSDRSPQRDGGGSKRGSGCRNRCADFLLRDGSAGDYQGLLTRCKRYSVRCCRWTSHPSTSRRCGRSGNTHGPSGGRASFAANYSENRHRLNGYLSVDQFTSAPLLYPFDLLNPATTCDPVKNPNFCTTG